LTNFFPIVNIMIHCRDMFGQVGPKKPFCPSPWVVNVRGSSDQIFQIAVISEHVSKFGCDPFSDLRDQASKKRRKKDRKKKNTAVKDKPFGGIAMPCGLITDRKRTQNKLAVFTATRQ